MALDGEMVFCAVIAVAMIAVAVRRLFGRAAERQERMRQLDDDADARLAAVPRKPAYAVLTFETANETMRSACAVGMAVFRDGEPAETYETLLNPQVRTFNPRFVEMHGITLDKVKDAPAFADAWRHLAHPLLTLPVVTWTDYHRKVLTACLRHAGITTPDGTPPHVRYADAAETAKEKIIGLANYRLETVAQYLCVPIRKRYDALSDAEAAGRIYAALYAAAPQVASSDTPATYAQQDYIRALGGTVPPVLTKADASALIDTLIAERNRRDELRALRARQAREAAEVKHIAAAIREKCWTPSGRGSKRTRDLREFQVLLAQVADDGVIDPEEQSELVAWLESRKDTDTDFTDAFTRLSAIQKGATADLQTDEGQELYLSLLNALTELRSRPIA